MLFSKILLKVTYLVLVFSYCISSEVQSEEIHKKCLNQEDKIGVTDIAAISHIERMMESKKDLEMLYLLSDLLQKNPGLVKGARRKIIKIIGSITDKNKLEFNENNFEKNKENVLWLIKKFTPEKGFKSYSNEMVLIHDLKMIFTIAAADLAHKNFKREIEATKNSDGLETITKILELFNQYSKVAKNYGDLKSSIAQDILLFLNANSSDFCARLSTWHLIEKNLGGGPYWESTGIETLKGINGDIIAAIQREPDSEIQVVANQISAKVKNLQTIAEKINKKNVAQKESKEKNIIKNNKKTVLKVQKKLRLLGYSPGPIDGMWGEKTRNALRSFQKEHEIDATGVLDTITIERLNLESDINKKKGGSTKHENKIVPKIELKTTEEKSTQSTDNKSIEEENKLLIKSKIAEEMRMFAEAQALFDGNKYEAANEIFKAFKIKFPESNLSDDAQFWIAESYFKQKQYNKAIMEYQIVIAKHKNSNKIPSSLFRQGLSFTNIGDIQNGKLLYKEIIKKYPDTIEAKQAMLLLNEIN